MGPCSLVGTHDHPKIKLLIFGRPTELPITEDDGILWVLAPRLRGDDLRTSQFQSLRRPQISVQCPQSNRSGLDKNISHFVASNTPRKQVRQAAVRIQILAAMPLSVGAFPRQPLRSLQAPKGRQNRATSRRQPGGPAAWRAMLPPEPHGDQHRHREAPAHHIGALSPRTACAQ